MLFESPWSVDMWANLGTYSLSVSRGAAAEANDIARQQTAIAGMRARPVVFLWSVSFIFSGFRQRIISRSVSSNIRNISDQSIHIRSPPAFFAGEGKNDIFASGTEKSLHYG